MTQCAHAGMLSATAVMLLFGCSQSATTEYKEFDDSESAPVVNALKTDHPVDVESEPGEVVLQFVGGTDLGGIPSTEQPDVPEAVDKDAELAQIVDKQLQAASAVVRNPADASTAEKRVPRPIQVLIKDRQFQEEGPQGAIRVSYDDIDLLKVLNMDPVTADAPEYMPQWLNDLDGKRIRIRGFMYPPLQETGNNFFNLARDNQICCFGKNPKIYDLFPVVMRKGETADYILNRPFDVVGVFHIKVETFDDILDRIYLIDDAVIVD